MMSRLIPGASRLALVAGAALALSGCVSIGTKAPNSLIALTPEASLPAGEGASGTLARSVVVMEPSADARIAVLRVAVQVDPTNIAYLKDAQWVERPSRQFQHLVAETLRARAGTLVVEGDVDSWQQRLSGRLLDMGYDVPSHSVVVRFDAVKETPGGHMETRRFESVIPHVGDHVKAITPAINHAANDVARQIVAWLG